MLPLMGACCCTTNRMLCKVRSDARQAATAGRALPLALHRATNQHNPSKSRAPVKPNLEIAIALALGHKQVALQPCLQGLAVPRAQSLHEATHT